MDSILLSGDFSFFFFLGTLKPPMSSTVLKTCCSDEHRHRRNVDEFLRNSMFKSYLSVVLEKEMATHSSIRAWRIPETEEPGGLLSKGSHRVGHD